MELNIRELSTVLAALRHWQAPMCAGAGLDAVDIAHIASNGGTVNPLTEEEIDTLWERLARAWPSTGSRLEYETVVVATGKQPKGEGWEIETGNSHVTKWRRVKPSPEAAQQAATFAAWQQQVRDSLGTKGTAIERERMQDLFGQGHTVDDAVSILRAPAAS